MKWYFKKVLTRLDAFYKNLADFVMLHLSDVIITIRFLPCYYLAADLPVSEQRYRIQKQLKGNEESSLILAERVFPLLLMASWDKTWKGLSQRALKIVTDL